MTLSLGREGAQAAAAYAYDRGHSDGRKVATETVSLSTTRSRPHSLDPTGTTPTLADRNRYVAEIAGGQLLRLADPVRPHHGRWAEYQIEVDIERSRGATDPAEIIIRQGVGGCPSTAGPDPHGFLTATNARAA